MYRVKTLKKLSQVSQTTSVNIFVYFPVDFFINRCSGFVFWWWGLGKWNVRYTQLVFNFIEIDLEAFSIILGVLGTS